jgi:hypothetical protein
MTSDYFASSMISLVLTWIAAIPALLGILCYIFSVFQKHEDIPWFFSVWIGLCFLVLSPIRYMFFLLVAAVGYPFQSGFAFFSVFWLGLLVPLAFGILYAAGFSGPLFATFWLLGKSVPSKKRYLISALAAPLFALIGSLLFSLFLPLASLSTHWLRAEDVIRATNGPAYYVFGYFGSSKYLVALPPYASRTPGTVRDLLRCHVAYVYLGERQHSQFLKMAYPEIYEQYSSSAIAGDVPISSDEAQRLETAIRPIEAGGLSEGDIRAVRSVLSDYMKRTGGKLSKAQYQQNLGFLRIVLNYKYALGESALLSWDSQRVVTTPDFDRLMAQVKGLITYAQRNEDQNMLEIAARHQGFIDTADGKRFEFSRTTLVAGRQMTKQKLDAMEKLTNSVADLLR